MVLPEHALPVGASCLMTGSVAIELDRWRRAFILQMCRANSPPGDAGADAKEGTLVSRAKRILPGFSCSMERF
jgi:hypothetical protein